MENAVAVKSAQWGSEWKNWEKCEKGRERGFKRTEEWQVISDVNSRKWDGNRKERPRGGWEMMVMIVKTSDDSSCPLCGDCSLINLAAEILPPWAKMRKAFPFLLLLLLFLYIFRCWLDEMRRFLLKYDRKENWSTTRPCKKIIIPSPLLAVTHTLLSLFLPLASSESVPSLHFSPFA